jgi:hypothetical protein
MRPFEKNVSQRTFFLGSGPLRMQLQCAYLDVRTTFVGNNSDTRRMRIPLKGGPRPCLLLQGAVLLCRLTTQALHLGISNFRPGVSSKPMEAA